MHNYYLRLAKNLAAAGTVRSAVSADHGRNYESVKKKNGCSEDE
jgi:hypothetical protein